jgi:hypothetical protein
MHESSRALRGLLDAVKSPDQERHRGAMKEWLAAQQRKREAWLAMATPLPSGNERDGH